MGILWIYPLFTTLFTFPFLLLLVRWIGKTQISQSTYFNWVAGACMGNIGANIITSHKFQDILLNATELFLFAGITVLASFIALKSKKFRAVTSGLPLILVNDGKIIYENLKKSKVNKDLLKELLREQGHFDYEKIKWAILEPTGILSVLPFEEEPLADDTDQPNPEPPSVKKQKKNQPSK